ncbi:MAG: DUF2723 domain-containing protein [Ignavibacteriaceae bacterium]|jgi:hypothetical protein|nr:MAG: DUF2723 domain-containing protein [Chlorobiota bacterium]KXK04942.1 MAG: hypothetical protein UZ04_CHB001000830 [Chlorobi bacterium OLB4]MBV6397758.1 hypothetical protein [Ignavibacteria bacterium]MCC6885537.1 DUF2723 domain-containing protein [Ignavibacteriales bacterium]MCE7952889.1 DUF2723 domain-containing protein [Chlorobi bacterium CHB7]MDL1886945.1 DUF2723 domain-containing protein [Ignavibacteria bacterium CHB1]MEB2328716.1 DUF2723 domain-containing protein [Ignavibacteriaceae
MNNTVLYRIIGAAVFLISFVIYLLTVQQTFAFWDAGEYTAVGYILGNSHPPGTPTNTLLVKIFTLILPFISEVPLRANLLSVICSSISVMLVYLVLIKILKIWRGEPSGTMDALFVCCSAAIGALSLSFADTIWFNALETEAYANALFFVTIISWLLMVWWEKANEQGSDNIFILIAFLIGLGIGSHLLVVQMLIMAVLIYYLRKFEYSNLGFLKALAVSGLAFVVVFPITVTKIPKIFEYGLIAVLIYVGLIVYGIYYSTVNKKPVLRLALLCLFFVNVGYSTYGMVFLRADIVNLPINQNAPKDMERFIAYMNREQYGEQPLIWPRRYTNMPHQQITYSNYSSDLSFMWEYQINEMYLRYLYWNFIGREGHDQGDGVDFSKFFAIPFIIGLFGLFYTYYRDKRFGHLLLLMFIVLGVLTALYQNQQNPQPRERDYFYFGSFFIFSMWIGIGVSGIIDLIKEKFIGQSAKIFSITAIVLLFVFIPFNMARVNYAYKDRSVNYLPYTYAYNLLQSLEKDAILFTNGDNDTFPLWALQAIYGIRTDVRVVNLSLAQIDWYNLQLKNERPYGALPVPFTFNDVQITKLQPVQWETNRVVKIPVPVSAYPDTMQTKPSELSFVMPPTIRQQSGNQVITAVKVNDLVVLDIIKANNWERPIYFSITVSSDNYIGLDEYLQLGGMAQKLLPYKVPMNSKGLSLNEEIMHKSLLEPVDEASSSPQYGFMFKNLDNPKLFLDDVQQRMIDTYRGLFMRLALWYGDIPEKKHLALKTVETMEQELPETVVPMDYRLKYDLAILLESLGDQERFNRYANDVIEGAKLEIEKNPGNFQRSYNPYQLSIEMLELQKRDAELLDMLLKVQALSPGDQKIQQKINEVKSRLGK